MRHSPTITLDGLRRFTVVRSLFRPTTLKRALYRLGFVQADPIRAPARAQNEHSHGGDGKQPESTPEQKAKLNALVLVGIAWL